MNTDSSAVRSEKKNFYRGLLALAIPIGLQNLLVAFIGASDALMLGRLAQDAVSAVSLANQIVFIMNLFVGAITGGGGALLAQYWGKDDRGMVKNIFCTLLKWTFGISVVFFALGMFLPQYLMCIYTTDPNLIDIGAQYIRIVSVSYLFSGVTQCYYLVMKLEGKAKMSVVISVATLFTDVFVDLFLIYGLAGLPKLGANGSAYSTIAVEAIALIWCIIISHRKGNIHADMKGFLWFSKDIFKDLFKIALPMLASSLAWGVGFSLHSLIMGHLGSDATAAASIASVAQELITCICKGVAAGAGIMIGKLLGQGLLDKAKEYGKRFCIISFAVGGINVALLAIIGPIVTIFFVLTERARTYLIWMLLFSAAYVFAYSINTIIVCGIFPAGGDSRYDAVSVLIASWCFALPLALLGTFAFHFPVIVVYIVMCADEIVKLPFLYPRYKKYVWLKNLTREEVQSE